MTEGNTELIWWLLGSGGVGLLGENMLRWLRRRLLSGDTIVQEMWRWRKQREDPYHPVVGWAMEDLIFHMEEWFGVKRNDT